MPPTPPDHPPAESSASRRVIPGFCGLCKSRCGSRMVVEDGRLVAQLPDPAHPTGRAQCVKGRAAPELVYDPQRVLHPLLRTRPKGDADPGWREISWDEAFDRIARTLGRIRDESGAEAVAFAIATPSGTPIADDVRWIERLANAFGSPNVANGTEICNWHKDFTHQHTFGRGIATPDFAHSRCIVLWGHNPRDTWLNNALSIAAARKRGARVVVIDPRKAGFAADADLWLRVRPGSDGALALGAARMMLARGWFDAAFLRDFSNGPLLVRSDTGRFLRADELALPPAGAGADDFVSLSANGTAIACRRGTRTAGGAGPDPLLAAGIELELAEGRRVRCDTAHALFEQACAPYTPERVAELCWIEAGQVEQFARLLHEASPAVSYYCWAGVCQHTNATQTDRAIATLMALTGSFDAPGGNVAFTPPPANDASGKALLGAAQRARCIGLARSRLGPARLGLVGSDALWDAILEREPYAIRALVGFGRDFLLNHADAERAAKALAALEFCVYADLTLTPTAALADLVLPICTPWEREALRVGFEGSQAAESWVQLRPAAIAPLGESRPDAWVVFELAQRLGLGEHFWDGDLEAGLAHILAPLGLSLDELRAHPGGLAHPAATRYRKYLDEGFDTPTGRIELYAETLLAHGAAPLPDFVEPADSPLTAADAAFPLVMTTAKLRHFRHGQDRQAPSLRRHTPEPAVHLHPDAARARGIAEGDAVRLRSAHGSIRLRARFDDTLDARVVWVEYGWWQPAGPGTADGYDALSEDGANYSRLVSDHRVDPVSGSQPLRSGLCEIEPVLGR
ncbi:molybdopterin-containing oxidoreductase family protein [Thauera aromatica]|uniref:MopB_CT_Acetylene-hydratase family molybdoenzyme n=1 Tax=Thauera aromatica K172 TaxID=44139 RepID=A0A2R4BPX2_THAAR|nr:molybdopterin-dependent oxidoreductase [Thauera aromatica]AVR89330.1 MopB_CT_Acetylene-hydratase family molybdoenzyme [Thauera aromatica K172]